MEETIAFLRQWIGTNVGQHLRHDYQVLAVTTLMLLDTTKANTNIVVKAPGAIHDARWMAKALYTLKIALFRNQTVAKVSIQKKSWKIFTIRQSFWLPSTQSNGLLLQIPEMLLATTWSF